MKNPLVTLLLAFVSPGVLVVLTSIATLNRVIKAARNTAIPSRRKATR